jgi:threonine dehydrogenase-like Zn-dependent dehydrogenase
LKQLASKRFPLEKITTHRFALKDSDTAIKAVGGAEDAIHVSIMPWM